MHPRVFSAPGPRVSGYGWRPTFPTTPRRGVRQFLDAQKIPAEDRVIRRIALRGFAAQGLALARADLVPEITITVEGVYWHPVGADDADLFLTAEIFPLAAAFATLRRALDRETEHGRRLATIFNCA